MYINIRQLRGMIFKRSFVFTFRPLIKKNAYSLKTGAISFIWIFCIMVASFSNWTEQRTFIVLRKMQTKPNKNIHRENLVVELPYKWLIRSTESVFADWEGVSLFILCIFINPNDNKVPLLHINVKRKSFIFPFLTIQDR